MIALGGHCLVRADEAPSIPAERRNVRRALRAIQPILLGGAPVALVHGNGPQVGHALIRSEEAGGHAYPLPLDVCVAQTQGEIGYLIQEALEELFEREGRARSVIAVLTRVLVHAPGPGESVPRKPVGPFFAHAPTGAFAVMADPAGRGYRRTVPSPRPLAVVGGSALRGLFAQGVALVAAGGGGIPAQRAPDGTVVPVEAVVDKDWAAALLACDLGATTILDLTEADEVRLGFGTAREEPLRTLTPEEARRHLAEGRFAEGSMRPKIEAALHFLETGGDEVVITSPERAMDALDGRAGTLLGDRTWSTDAPPPTRTTVLA